MKNFPDRIDLGDGYSAWVARFCHRTKGRAVRVFLGDDEHPLAQGYVEGDREAGVEAARTFKALHRGASA